MKTSITNRVMALRHFTRLTTLALTATALAFEPDIIIDDTHPSAVEFVGPWTADTVLTNAYRGSAKVLTGTTANVAEYARFHTLLPATGPWRVFVWSNARAGFGDQVRTEVKLADGAVSSSRWVQEINAGRWILLGTFWFDSATEAEVKILHSDVGMLSVDAVRFSHHPGPEVMLDSTGDSVGIKLLNAAGNISSTTWPTLGLELAGNEMSIRRSTTVGSRVEFSPVLPTPGDYEVAVWLPSRNTAWTSSGTPAESVQVEVHGRTGFTTHTVALPVDNGPFEGAWVPVGSTPFRFDATPVGQTSGPGKVIIKGPTTAGICVPADAVRWTKVGTIAIYQDNDDPTGITLSTKLASQTAAWEAIIDTHTDRIARSYANYRYQPFGLDATRALNNEQRATYTPALPEQGLYDVYLWSPYSTANALTTLLTIKGTYDASGTSVDVTRTLDQTKEAGTWAHMGRYILDANPPGGPVKSWLTIEPNANPSGKTSKADGALFLRDGEELDTDGDGLPDWKEIILHTNNSGLDLNNDGIADGWDTDGDGMSDGDEYRMGFDPLTAAQVVSAAQVGLLRYTPLRSVNE